MNLQTLRASPHLSASSISDYLECSLSYKFRRVDQIEFEHTSDSLLFGSTIHKCIEEYYQAKMKNHIIPLETLLKRFEEQWKEMLDLETKVIFKEGKDAETCLQEGKALLTVFHQELPQDSMKVIGTETPFSIQIPGLPIPIIGCMDLLLQDSSGNIVIVDHKTSSKAFSQDDVDNSMQLTIYHMAAKHYGYSDTEILLRYDALIKTKKPKFDQYYTSRTEEDEQRLVKKIQHVWDAIEKEVFIPNDGGWKCGYCSFRNHCNHWFKNNNF